MLPKGCSRPLRLHTEMPLLAGRPERYQTARGLQKEKETGDTGQPITVLSPMLMRIPRAVPVSNYIMSILHLLSFISSL